MAQCTSSPLRNSQRFGQGVHWEIAHRHDDVGLDQLDLPQQTFIPRLQLRRHQQIMQSDVIYRLLLLLPRNLGVKRTSLRPLVEEVGAVALRSHDACFMQHTVELLSGGTLERSTRTGVFVSVALPHQHNASGDGAFTEHHPSPFSFSICATAVA